MVLQGLNPTSTHTRESDSTWQDIQQAVLHSNADVPHFPNIKPSRADTAIAQVCGMFASYKANGCVSDSRCQQTPMSL